MFSLFDLPLSTLLIVILAIGFAGLVHGTLGLGFPMVATPLLATMVDVRSAILITLLPTMAVNLISIFRSPNSLSNTQKFSPLILFTLLGSIVGAYILSVMEPSPFRIVLAGLILIYLASSYLAKIPSSIFLAQPFFWMATVGLLAGLSTGTTNVMVAVLIIYFLSLETPRSTIIPVMNSCFLVGKISQIIVFSLTGLIGASLVIESLPLAALATVTLLVGQKIQPHIKIETYQNLLKVLLLTLALILITQFFLEL
ncbi:MAG: putative membrane protein YfcA [Gammaproteobacteria bacterium]